MLELNSKDQNPPRDFARLENPPELPGGSLARRANPTLIYFGSVRPAPQNWKTEGRASAPSELERSPRPQRRLVSARHNFQQTLRACAVSPADPRRIIHVQSSCENWSDHRTG